MFAFHKEVRLSSSLREPTILITPQFRASEKLIQDSSEDEDQVGGSTIHKAFDKLFSNEDGFPFIVGGQFAPVTQVHPNPIQIFQLWQVYIDNINSLLKITHVPTIQPQILQAASSLDRAPKNIEALMFGIYVMALTSMEERDVQTMFNEPKQHVLTRFLSATQQALVNVSFMKIDDAIVLQAFVLYLVRIRASRPQAFTNSSSMRCDGSLIRAKFSV